MCSTLRNLLRGRRVEVVAVDRQKYTLWAITEIGVEYLENAGR